MEEHVLNNTSNQVFRGSHVRHGVTVHDSRGGCNRRDVVVVILLMAKVLFVISGDICGPIVLV
eukprot:2774638-Prorocentrum_lima.AAC.1